MRPPAPPVSVLLANWNGARFLSEAIASVVAQTWHDWEMIVVDTGSTDESADVIKGWAAQDARIKPILKEHQMLCPPALNLGLAEARGRFIARIESDDLWRPERLMRQLDFYASPGAARVGICGSDVTLIDETGASIGAKVFPKRHADCLKAIWYRNPFCHSAVMIRKEALDKVGGYDEKFFLIEDLELWFRLGRFWEFANLAEPLASYRLWGGSLTSRRLLGLAWRQHRVRRRAAREFGFTQPAKARAYSWATVAIAALPPLMVRKLFELGARRLGTKAKSENQASAKDRPQRQT